MKVPLVWSTEVEGVLPISASAPTSVTVIDVPSGAGGEMVPLMMAARASAIVMSTPSRSSLPVIVMTWAVVGENVPGKYTGRYEGPATRVVGGCGGGASTYAGPDAGVCTRPVAMACSTAAMSASIASGPISFCRGSTLTT